MKRYLDGLRLQLLGLIILPFSLLLLALAIAGVQVHQRAMRRLVAERDERAVRATAAAISQQLHHLENALSTLTLRVSDGALPEIIIEQANYLAEDYDGGIAIGKSNGEIIASTIPENRWSAMPLSELIVRLKNDDTEFSDPFTDTDNGMKVLVATLRDDWIAVGAFTVTNLLRTASLGPLSDADGYSTFLTDNSGRVLTSFGTALPEDYLSKHPGVEAALRGETGSSYLPAEDGEHVVAFSPILPTSWALIIEEPWEAVASPILDISLAAPLTLVPVLIVTLIALWFGARQVVVPLRQLEQKADKLAEGDYDAVEDPVGGIAEIQHLQKTLGLMAQRIRAAQQTLRGYINTMTRTQEDERRRLARELHDETIQDLIALDQQVQMIGMNLRQQGLDDIEGLRELHQATQDSIHKVRRLSRGLRPIYLEDLGLIPALEMLSRDSQSELEIPITFKVEGEVYRLGPEVELALYRIVQETLSNVGRHAQAKHVWMEVIFDETDVLITVQDDGVGFLIPDQTSEFAHDGHYGLIGMYERSVLIDAQLNIHSDPDHGTSITIHLPRS